MSLAYRRIQKVTAALLIMGAASACDLSAISNIGGGRLVSISVSGDTMVAVGDTIRLHAAGGLDGLIGLLSYDPLRDASWVSTDPTLAVVVRPPPSPEDTLFSFVLVKGVHPGRVVIQAKARGVTGGTVVNVRRAIPPPSMSR